jgi:hypothetical protein
MFRLINANLINSASYIHIVSATLKMYESLEIMYLERVIGVNSVIIQLVK